MPFVKRRKLNTSGDNAVLTKSKAIVTARREAELAKDEDELPTEGSASPSPPASPTAEDAPNDGAKENSNGGTEEPKKTFADLGIIPSLCDACDALGYKAPTPIQRESIPHAIEGRDLIGLAETGSGKTAAFGLPMLQALMSKPQPYFGLILAPTRELAFQISKSIEALGSLISVRCATIVGGMDMVSQAIALGKKPHVVVATPGRLLDHLENTKGFSLRALKYLVMDEADRLLDLDFGTSLHPTSPSQY